MRKKSSTPMSRKSSTRSKRKISQPKTMNEEMPEEIRENILLENVQQDSHTNWSQAQDRSEDFINEADPFTQEMSKTPKIPRDNRL